MLVGFFIGVAFCSMVGAAGIYGAKEFLKEVRINTTKLPIGYVYWNNPITGERVCYHIDVSRWAEAPKVDWMSAFDYIHGYVIQTFGNPPLTQEESAFCFDKAPQYAWTVSPNGKKLDRPVYSGPAWFENGLWIEIGRAAIGQLCSISEERKTTYSYHYIMATNGKQGLVACDITVLK